MTLIFSIFAMETFCERFLLQYVHKGAIGLLLIIAEAMPILPQFLIQSTKVFHLKIRPTLTPQVQTDTIKSMFLSSGWKKKKKKDKTKNEHLQEITISWHLLIFSWLSNFLFIVKIAWMVGVGPLSQGPLHDLLSLLYHWNPFLLLHCSCYGDTSG